MVGLPSWVDSERFDIEARAEGNPSKDQFRLMAQSLLADRFKLTMHHETRQVGVLVLLKSGKTGPLLTAHTDDTACVALLGPTLPQPASGAALPPLPCGIMMPLLPTEPGRFRLGARKVTMEELATMLSGLSNFDQSFDRPVVDQTGLSGSFDFTFEFTPQPQNAPPDFQPDLSGPSLQEALQEQLGLKLESQRAPIDVMVIDRLEQPSEN